MGPKGVLGVNTGNEIFKKTATDWERVPGHLIDVSVGYGSVWGVNRDGTIYSYTEDGVWKHVPGGLKQVTVMVMVGVLTYSLQY